MLNYLLLLIPMFYTERLALTLDDDNQYMVLCYEDEVTEILEPLVFNYGTVKGFAWLGVVIASNNIVLDEE